jgi:hypothetical protein
MKTRVGEGDGDGKLQVKRERKGCVWFGGRVRTGGVSASPFHIHLGSGCDDDAGGGVWRGGWEGIARGTWWGLAGVQSRSGWVLTSQLLSWLLQ